MFRRCVPFLFVFLSAMVTLTAVTHAQQVLFQDDLSDGGNFRVFGDDDTNATFGFDYSQNGIPPAPNGNDTIGLIMAVNIVEPAEVTEIAAVHVNDEFNGQYTFTVDVWNNWDLNEVDNPTKVGTTEFSGAGVGHAGVIAGPDGASFLYDGDGDTAADYRLYKNTELQALDTGQYAIEDNNNVDPVLAEAFPGFDIRTVLPGIGLNGSQVDGAGGFQWMTITIEVDTDAIGAGTADVAGVATVKLTSDSSGNTVEIGTIDNSIGSPGSPVSMNESIALLMSDIFSSVSPAPQHSFAVFDNVKVVRGIGVVEPTVDVDFDDNGSIDTFDVDALVTEIAAGTNDPSFDLTGDTLVNGEDLTLWRGDAATANGFGSPYLLGDANLDGTVDAGDLNQVGINWQAAIATWSAGDFNGDGGVNAADLNDLGIAWQQSIPSLAAAHAVPEPGTLLMCLWLLVVGWASRCASLR